MVKQSNPADLARIVAKAKDDHRREMVVAVPDPPLSDKAIAEKESRLMDAWAAAVIRGDNVSADNMMDEMNRLKGLPVRKRK